MGPCPNDLYDQLRPTVRRRAAGKKKQYEWTVNDDWPDARSRSPRPEIEVFEAWFGDLFDELFFNPPLSPVLWRSP